MVNTIFYDRFTLSCLSQNFAIDDNCGFLYSAATINDICFDYERKFVFD